MRFVAALVKLIGIALAGIVAIFLLIVVVFGWSRENVERTDASCNARRIEKRVESQSTEAYHDYCMRAAGYRKMSSCITLGDNAYAPVPSCYFPKWVFWIN